jgi:hypothetical protein
MAKKRISVGLSSGSGSRTTIGGATLSGSPILPSGGAFTPISFPSSYTITTLVQTPISEPVFDFYIPNSEFYLNTPGVSVASVAKSATNIEDGTFNIMNKTNQIIYYKSLVFNNATVRNPNYVSYYKNLTVTKTNTTYDDNYAYEIYSVSKNEQRTSINTQSISSLVAPTSILIGYLQVRYPIEYYSGSVLKINPFECVPISVNYQVFGVGDLTTQIYGQTTNAPNRKVATFDFNFSVQTYDSDPNSTTSTPNISSQDLVLSINLVNTGYIPPVYNYTFTPPSTGTGYLPAPSYPTISGVPTLSV